MVAGCSATCVKYIFFTFNFLIFVSGGTILGVSLWARYDKNFIKNAEVALQNANVNIEAKIAEMENIRIALLVLAILGAGLLICGFLGCCGACCESTCLLGLFIFVMLALFLVEMAAGIYILVKKGDIKNDMKFIIEQLYTSDNAEVIRVRTDMETTLSCCGVEGCSLGFGLGPIQNLACCVNKSTIKGCADVLYDQLKSNFAIVSWIAVGLAGLEVLAMMFACFLCSAIRSTAYSYY